MFGQSQNHLCGPCALANALEARGGPQLTEDEAKAACGTTTGGTTVAGLKRALRKLGVAPKDWNLPWDNAVARLRMALDAGRPVILCVEADTHYVAAIGLLGDKVVVYDSSEATSACWNAAVLGAKWKGAKGKFYGLELG